MKTETLLHLHYLNRVFILVNKENYGDYSLHVKVGNQIERKVFKEVDGYAKERLVANLVTVERYYLFVEREETGKTEEEIKWDDSYVQLIQFIETLHPLYSVRLAYLRCETLEKTAERWISTYVASNITTNRLQNTMPLFRLIHEKGVQQVEWIASEAYVREHYPHFEQAFTQVKEDEWLLYQNEINPDAPRLFEGFDDLLD